MITSFPELIPVFTEYEALVKQADTAFSRVASMYSECIACKSGCSDCCHATFDLSLVEAMYLNAQFRKTFDFGPQRSAILERASETDRHLTRLKRDYFRQLRDAKAAGPSPDVATEATSDALQHILDSVSRVRIRCPLLDENDHCALYDSRPITCRLYGIPSVIAGQTHVCGKTGFNPGQSYPTIKLDKIQDRLDQLSQNIRDAVHSRFTELHTVYVPVSMALLTNYDNAYLGIGPAPRDA